MTDMLVDGRSGIPSHFCWTKFGTEAGEPIRRIRERKERERLRGDGVFLWGIGNSVGPSLKLLLKHDDQPAIIFTPMLSRPAKIDAAPDRVVEWAGGEGLDGRPHRVPDHCNVISRASSRPGRSKSHYALVCFSESPIDEDEGGVSFSREDVVNLVSKAPVGSSQVTAVVERAAATRMSPAPYEVAFRAVLVYPYIIRLTEPVGALTVGSIPPAQAATLSRFS